MIKQGDRDDLNDAYFAALEAHPHWASELPASCAGPQRLWKLVEMRSSIGLIAEAGSTRLKANLEWESRMRS